jgi:hypothetical protein
MYSVCLCVFLGLPTFTRQPDDRNVTRNSPFNLSCEAVGPPNPIRIHWLRNGVRVIGYITSSPSNYTVPGERDTYMHAHTHTRAHAKAHAQMSTRTCVYMHTHTHTYAHTCTCTNIHTHICTYTHAHIHEHAHTHICTYNILLSYEVLNWLPILSQYLFLVSQRVWRCIGLFYCSIILDWIPNGTLFPIKCTTFDQSLWAKVVHYIGNMVPFWRYP